MSPAFHLHTRAERKAARAEGGARGQALRIEVPKIDFVERRPFTHVCEHDRAFEDIIERQAAMCEHAGDVLHHLTDLGFYPAGRKFHRAGDDSELAREIENISDANGIREGQVQGFVARHAVKLHPVLRKVAAELETVAATIKAVRRRWAEARVYARLARP